MMQVPSIPTARGFTLLEMIVVLMIIGLILGLVGPRIFGAGERSKTKIAEAKVQTLRTSLETYRLDMGNFPTTEQGLNALVTSPNEPAAKARWKGPYAGAEDIIDPWDTPFNYKVPGESGTPFSLYSYGADKKPGGESNDADIGIGVPAAGK